MDDELLELLFPATRSRRSLREKVLAGKECRHEVRRVSGSMHLLDRHLLPGRSIASCAKDYLSSLESDKIRDADGTNERIKLFLSFADDRLKKFQYELQHPSSNKHPEMLNALMNAYVGCVDDAADLVQLGIQKQENIRAGLT